MPFTYTCETCGVQFTRAASPASRTYRSCSNACRGKLRVEPLEDRLWAKIDRRGPDECWLWTGARSAGGYGNIMITKHPPVYDYAHRVVYRLAHGPIPNGHEVMHSCDVRLCCNPTHLSAGTPHDNVQDMMAKGRHHPAWTGVSGEDHPSSVLSNETRRQIVEEYQRGGITQATLAKKYNIAQSHVSRLVIAANFETSPPHL